ncbi:MAG: hypothetical protein PVI73_08165 [Syntrophobacterales bacterium]
MAKTALLTVNSSTVDTSTRIDDVFITLNRSCALTAELNGRVEWPVLSESKESACSEWLDIDYSMALDFRIT